ncbi:hypothetical protein GIB67_040212 [Kingdonia uniflora]|uniref:Uncharacterized protein n=1 Tax=Kingdonia uniflora TaxID=39325 RepID=A0A7J7MVH9_9MAGN|nr:hypothetical protein GIB67_040212 [Kingdonia uniflora]
METPNKSALHPLGEDRETPSLFPLLHNGIPTKFNLWHENVDWDTNCPRFGQSRSADAEEAEALEALRGLEAARHLGLQRILLLSNCQRIVSAFRERPEDLSWGALTLAPDMRAVATIFVGYLFINNGHLIWESLASAPSKNVPTPSMTAEIYAKIAEKTRVFQFLQGSIPTLSIHEFIYLTRLLSQLLKRYTHIVSPIRVVGHLCFLSSRSLQRLLLWLFVMLIRVLSQGEYFLVRHLPLKDLSSPPSDPLLLSNSCFGPSSTTFILVTINNDSHVSHSDDDRPITIQKEKRNTGTTD